MTKPDFTIGIEAEYLLVDRSTRDPVGDPPTELIASFEEALGRSVARELMRCRIEIDTPACKTRQWVQHTLWENSACAGRTRKRTRIEVANEERGRSMATHHS
jgi:gamma-glutamyl:cysteine ligase YbdK (ATP-grasp superfamily)